MTLGEKLYELRARRGLSQLELAEALDVSRQSVSKWETDAAVPEIDKLIALSRYFGVPIGALLGVEEERAEEHAADEAPDTDGELTETQLKMVEEIVSRYVAALPQPMPKKRKTVLKVAVAVAAVCLAVGLYKISNQLTELHYRYNDLANSLSMVNSNVSSQINSITGRVEAALEQQTRITADASVEIVSADVPGRMVAFAVRATPKTYVEGMTAYFEFENDGARVSFGPVEPVGTTFAMECGVALTDEINVYVVFEHDGQRETQLLDGFYGLYSDTLPSVWVDDLPSHEYTFADGKAARVKGDWCVQVSLSSAASGEWSAFVRPAVITSVEVGLFRDHRLLWWAERLDGPPDNWDVTNWNDTLFFHYPDDADAFLPGGAYTQGGELQSVARVTDSYGRVFLFVGQSAYSLAEDGTLDWHDSTDAAWEGDACGRIDDLSGWDFTPAE